ncbi:AAEL007204-PA [Aedes aegypti]|uniref:AAEL007204-PA n=1 Tax=Aedes aegypti TaxID=7159 RepID=Q173A8_AEDAE|nr:AAEL007204-PA [Aedes aegypti]
MMANKVITILSVVLFAFVISTTVLAVQKNDQAAEIDDLRAQLDASSTPSPTTTSETEQTTFELTPTTTPSMETSPAPTTTTTMATTTEAPLPPDHYRLPNDVIPLHYDLWLHPNLDEGTFTGRVSIDVSVVSTTRTIVLHSNGLTITNPSLKLETSLTPITLTPQFDLEREFLQLNVPISAVLQPDTNATISMSFSGKMSGKIVGLYSSSYPTENGETVFLVLLLDTICYNCFASNAFASATAFTLSLVQIKPGAKLAANDKKFPKVRSIYPPLRPQQLPMSETLNLSTLILIEPGTNFRFLSRYLELRDAVNYVWRACPPFDSGDIEAPMAANVGQMTGHGLPW